MKLIPIIFDWPGGRTGLTSPVTRRIGERWFQLERAECAYSRPAERAGSETSGRRRPHHRILNRNTQSVRQLYVYVRQHCTERAETPQMWLMFMLRTIQATFRFIKREKKTRIFLTTSNRNTITITTLNIFFFFNDSGLVHLESSVLYNKEQPDMLSGNVLDCR